MKVIPWEVKNIRTNSRYLRELKDSLSLSALQKRVLCGTLMGDGCIIPTASDNNYRLQIEQSDQQREYLFWKYEIFKEFVVTPPKYIASLGSWRFRTISHKEFVQLRSIFYRDGKKVLPQNLYFLADPLVLAVWFMDDGSHYSNGSYIINTQNFTPKENIRIINFLSDNFGLKSLTLHRDRKYYRIAIGKQSSTEFQRLFEFEILSSMKYKLFNPVET